MFRSWSRGLHTTRARLAADNKDNLDVLAIFEQLGSKARSRGSANARPSERLNPTNVRAATVPRVPRTGPLVGRSVQVRNLAQLPSAISQVNALNRINRMKQTVRLQQFAERPGKARLRIRIERKKREFNEGIRRLFDLVNEARRQGY